MKKLLITMMMAVVGMTMSAQTTSYVTVEPAGVPEDGEVHAMTIHFVDGTVVSYSLEEIDTVTYLPEVGLKIRLKANGECRDYLFSQMSRIIYEIEEKEVVIDDGNKNANWTE